MKWTITYKWSTGDIHHTLIISGAEEEVAKKDVWQTILHHPEVQISLVEEKEAGPVPSV